MNPEYAERIMTALRFSVGFMIVPVIVALIYLTVRSRSTVISKKKPMSSSVKLVVISLFLLGAIWSVRFAVGYYSAKTAVSEAAPLRWWEELVSSLLEAIKTFSIGDGFDDFLRTARKMSESLWGVGSQWSNAFVIYVCVLNFFAPLAGGAIVFELLASIFPRIRLCLSYVMIWREKYFFSELNERSLALVRSLRGQKHKRFCSPVIIFTDTYVDDESEKSAELSVEARLLGAICVRDDLSHIRKNRFGKRVFYLIDENENGNLQTFADLANDTNHRYLKKTEVYLFSQSANYLQVERQVCAKLMDKYGFKGDRYSDEKEIEESGKKFENELPTVIPVQIYRNLIMNLLEELPLYEPLVGKKRNDDGTVDLTVTVFGAGQTGIEMFLSTYWYGQILDCNLTINMISMESEDAFWSRIDYVNPEIRHTTDADDPILIYNRRGDANDPYCKVNYIEAKIGNGNSVESLGVDKGVSILDSDYFLVALGSDELDLSVAESLRRCVGIRHLHKNDGSRAIISYVIYDSGLCSVLNQSCCYNSANCTADIYMRAIGDLDEVYSVENIEMTGSKEKADSIDMNYMDAQNKMKRARSQGKRRDDEYKHWESISRLKHFKYKVFSVGLVKTTVFDTGGTDSAEYIEAQMCAEKQFRAMVEDANRDRELMHKLAWLEHRRWNAFTRVKGFRYSDRYTIYYNFTESHKHMDLKLHPCLVECSKAGIKAKFKDNGKIDKDDLFKSTDYASFDLLDELSYELLKLGYNKYDFKIYDYPEIDLT